MSESTTRRPRCNIYPNNGNIIRPYRHRRVTINVPNVIHTTTRCLIKGGSRIFTLHNGTLRPLRGILNNNVTHPNKIMRLINNRITRILRRYNAPTKRVRHLWVRQTLRNLGLLYDTRFTILFRPNGTLNVPRLRNDRVMPQRATTRCGNFNMFTFTTNDTTRRRYRR